MSELQEYSVEWFRAMYQDNPKWLGTQAQKLWEHYLVLEEEIEAWEADLIELDEWRDKAALFLEQGEKLEAMEKLVEVAEEAERVANEAHLAADYYAYDLMRTVLRPLVGEMEMSVEEALAAAQEERE